MIRLKILNSYYKVIDGYDINESSREVKFSNIKIDFTDKTILDLPYKYQEIQLVDVDNEYNINKVIYTGYVSNFILPNMKNEHEYRELEIELLSPLAMATVRTVDAVGTYDLEDLIIELVQPLINDGFILKQMNVGTHQATVNYLSETVESALNKLSNKYNFWWYIDQNKNIYINSITYLMSLKPKLVYDDENKIEGLIDLIPSIDATDYCNVVNFTNLRMYNESYFYSYIEDGKTVHTYSYPLFMVDTISKGDKIEFNYPFDISAEATKKMREICNGYYASNPFTIRQTINNIVSYKLRITYINGSVVIPNNVTLSDSYSDENEWVLVRDPFFKNLIVGLQYNGNETINVYSIESITALVWAKMRYQDNEEINKNKGVVSNTGIIERQIDMKEQWKTYDEIISIANSYIKKNISRVDEVKLGLDEDIQLNIGDTVKINKQNFLINDLYIVTDKKYNFSNNYEKWDYKLKNTNILENYVDLFRTTEKQEEQKNYNLITSDYVSEGFNEIYEVIVNES